VTEGGGDAPLRISVSYDLLGIPGVAMQVRGFLDRCGIADRTKNRAEVAIEEVLTNVIRHGRAAPGARAIEVEVRCTDGGVHLRVIDDGIAFDPRTAPAFDPSTPLEQRTAGGMGIHLLRSFARELRYVRDGDRNRFDVIL